MKEKIVDEKKVACLKVFQLYEHLFFHPFHLDFSLNFQFESKRSFTSHTKKHAKGGRLRRKRIRQVKHNFVA